MPAGSAVTFLSWSQNSSTSFDFRQAKKDGENETMKHERVGGDQEGPGEEGEETRKCVYFRGKKKKTWDTHRPLPVCHWPDRVWEGGHFNRVPCDIEQNWDLASRKEGEDEPRVGYC